MSAKPPHSCVLLRRTHQIFSRSAALWLHVSNSHVCLCMAGGKKDAAGICVGPWVSQMDVAGAISTDCRRTVSSLPVAELKYSGINLGHIQNHSQLIVF